MMGLNGILGILLIAIILWVVMRLSNKYRSNNPDMGFLQDPYADNKNALGLLKERLASGEISQLEYERMKKDIL